MTTGVNGNEFQDTLDEVRRLMQQVRTPPADQEPVEAEAADGQVRVAMQADGDLTSITVDPKLLRDGLDAICEHVVAAVNDGHAQLRRRAAAATVSVGDTDAMTAQLQELQTQSVRQMAAFGNVLNDVAAQLRKGGTS